MSDVGRWRRGFDGWAACVFCGVCVVFAVVSFTSAVLAQQSRGGSIASEGPDVRSPLDENGEYEAEDGQPMELPPEMLEEAAETVEEAAEAVEEAEAPEDTEAPADDGVQEIVFGPEEGEDIPIIRTIEEDEGPLPAPDGEAGEAAPAPPSAPRPGPPPAEAPPRKPGTVTNYFYDTDLREALSELSQQSEKWIVVGPEVQGYVTMSFEEVPLEEALKLLLAGTGYIIHETEDYYLVTSSEVTSTSFLEMSETELVRLDYLDAASAKSLLPEALQDYVATDAERNLISITAPPPVMERIKADLKVLDAAPLQMVLETRIVVMETSDLLNMGINWDWPSLTAGTYSNDTLHGQLQPAFGPKWPWGIQLGYTPGREFTNALNLTLNLLSANDQVNVIANLHVMALDGEEAEISVTTEEYFEILTQGFYTQSKLEQVEAGTVLQMTPRISENGDIKLTISTEVSDVLARGESDLPVVTRRVASSSVRVKEGGTVVVAGLTDSRSRRNNQRVPGIGEVPVVGEPFRDQAGEERTRQIYVFVTPRLIREDTLPEEAQLAKRETIPLAGDEFTQRLRELVDAD